MKRYVEIFQERALFIPPVRQTEIIGASVQFSYRDMPNKVECGYFSFGVYCEDRNEDSFGVFDDLIFFYCNGQVHLDKLMKEGTEDFIVHSYQLERAEIGERYENYFN